jgi:hypothetical protein
MQILRESKDFRRRKVNSENKGLLVSCNHLFPSFFKVIKKKSKSIITGDNHSPPTSAEVKKIWIYTFTPPYALMA